MADKPPAPTPPPVPAPKAKGDPGGAGSPTGAFAAPPPHAPKETTKPLDPAIVAAQVAKASANEKELAPLQFALDKAVAAGMGAQTANPQGLHPVVTASPSAPPNAPAGTSGVPPAPPVPPVAPHQPAGSNTDSPSRGVPKPILDPNKQITGGWGFDQSGGFDAQYYALDGTELLTLIKTIWTSLQSQLSTDLRFGIATVYPQVAARVTIEIGGAHDAAPINDVAFNIESSVYRLSGVRVDDNSTPADALRDEASLDRPFKRLVRTPTGTYIVDRIAPNAIPADTDTDTSDLQEVP